MTTLQQEIKGLYKELWDLEKKSKMIKDIIQVKQDLLQSNCDHEWEKDCWSCDHKTHYICKTCDLYR